MTHRVELILFSNFNSLKWLSISGCIDDVTNRATSLIFRPGLNFSQNFANSHPPNPFASYVVFVYRPGLEQSQTRVFQLFQIFTPAVSVLHFLYFFIQVSSIYWLSNWDSCMFLVLLLLYLFSCHGHLVCLTLVCMPLFPTLQVFRVVLRQWQAVSATP